MDNTIAQSNLEVLKSRGARTFEASGINVEAFVPEGIFEKEQDKQDKIEDWLYKERSPKRANRSLRRINLNMNKMEQKQPLRQPQFDDLASFIKPFLLHLDKHNKQIKIEYQFRTDNTGFVDLADKKDNYIPKHFLEYYKVMEELKQNYDNEKYFQEELISNFIEVSNSNFQVRPQIQEIWNLLGFIIPEYLKLIEQEQTGNIQVNFGSNEEPNYPFIYKVLFICKKYLEKKFFEMVNNLVDELPQNPTSIGDKIKLFVEYLHGGDILIVNDNMDNEYFIWSVFYYMLRSGQYELAINYFNDNLIHLCEHDQQIFEHLKYYFEKERFLMPLEWQQQIIEAYNNHVELFPDRPNTYKLLSLRMVASIQPEHINSEISKTLEDVMWFQLQMGSRNFTNANQDYDGKWWDNISVIEYFKSYKLSYLRPDPKDPFTLVYMYLLSAQFAEAIDLLFLYSQYQIDALHLALCLHNYDLLKDAKFKQGINNSNVIELNTKDAIKTIDYFTLITKVILNLNVKDWKFAMPYLCFISKYENNIAKQFIKDVLRQIVLSSNDYLFYFGVVNDQFNYTEGELITLTKYFNIEDGNKFFIDTLIDALALLFKNKDYDLSLKLLYTLDFNLKQYNLYNILEIDSTFDVSLSIIYTVLSELLFNLVNTVQIKIDSYIRFSNIEFERYKNKALTIMNHPTYKNEINLCLKEELMMVFECIQLCLLYINEDYTKALELIKVCPLFPKSNESIEFSNTKDYILKLNDGLFFVVKSMLILIKRILNEISDNENLLEEKNQYLEWKNIIESFMLQMNLDDLI